MDAIAMDALKKEIIEALIPIIEKQTKGNNSADIDKALRDIINQSGSIAIELIKQKAETKRQNNAMPKDIIIAGMNAKQDPRDTMKQAIFIATINNMP